jgi:hypothetical protein
MQRDADLPGVLVLIYTIRKYSKLDRDILVFVASNVSCESLCFASTALRRVP